MTARVFLNISSKVDTVKGHCKRLGIQYSTITSRVADHYEYMHNVPESVLSAWMGVPVRIVGKPADLKEILNYRGRFREVVDGYDRDHADHVHPAVQKFVTMALSRSPCGQVGYY